MTNPKPNDRLSPPTQTERDGVRLNKALGKLIEHYRAEMKLSLEELAELTDVSVRDLGQLESGKCSLALEQLFKISNYINIPPSALLSAIHHDDGN